VNKYKLLKSPKIFLPSEREIRGPFMKQGGLGDLTISSWRRPPALK